MNDLPLTFAQPDLMVVAIAFALMGIALVWVALTVLDTRSDLEKTLKAIRNDVADIWHETIPMPTPTGPAKVCRREPCEQPATINAGDSSYCPRHAPEPMSVTKGDCVAFNFGTMVP